MLPRLIIVTDLGTTKFYRVTKDLTETTPHIDLIRERNTPVAGGRTADRASDQAGRFPVSNGIAGGAMSAGEDHGFTQELERRLIREIASEISGVVERESPVRWDFAASKEINQRIVDELAGPAKTRLGRNVGADLVKIPKAELLGHF
jgi:hypothetical protein